MARLAAAAKARTGFDIVSKTRRQEFRAGQGDNWDLLEDADSDRAWGVAEWSSRVGQGTYFDWLAANSLLPDHDSDPEHEGIRVIDLSADFRLRTFFVPRGDELLKQLDIIWVNVVLKPA